MIPQVPKVSIIIAAYNEADTVAAVVRAVDTTPLPHWGKEIIVVDDGSTDGTRTVLAQLPVGMCRIIHKNNGGKGSALKQGLAYAIGDAVVFQDADMEYSPADIPALLKPLEEGLASVVLGIREPVRAGRPMVWYVLYRIGNSVITALTNILFWNTAQEYEACYKAFWTPVLRSVAVRENGFAYDNELVCKLLRRGYRTVDVPIRYVPRSYHAGKKIRWRDGLRILWVIVRCRFERL